MKQSIQHLSGWAAGGGGGADGDGVNGEHTFLIWKRGVRVQPPTVRVNVVTGDFSQPQDFAERASIYLAVEPFSPAPCEDAVVCSIYRLGLKMGEKSEKHHHTT